MSTASTVVSAATSHVAYAPVNADDNVGDLEAVTPLRGADATTVEMVAPADLRAGFQFTAQLDGQPIQVEVPYSVREGQIFHANVIARKGTRDGGSMDIQDGPGSENFLVGRWRDSTCDLFHLCFLAVCCVPVLLGQVLTRLNLNLLGRPRRGRLASGITAFKVLFILNLMIQVLGRYMQFQQLSNALASFPLPAEKPTGYVSIQTLFFIVLLYLTYLTFAMRQYVRERYRIPVECCCNGCCEDFWCACCCMSCAVMQMACHTRNTATQNIMCCTETGLQDKKSGPVIV